MSDKKFEEKIVDSKLTGKRRPSSTVTRNREPNFDLMAKALINLYYQTKDDEIDKKKLR